MDNISLNFGKRVRSLRTSKNISQEKLAELCGLHPTYIGQLERGEKSPTLDSIYKISVGLETPLDKLFQNLCFVSAEEDIAAAVYNEIIKLPEAKQKAIKNIITDIINL